MILNFEKFQGTGNDFVLIDNRKDRINLSVDQIKQLCDRRFGIGADGVILIKEHASLDFEMQYFNADGTRSFCGNGARCAVRFSQQLGLCQTNTRFLAVDGEHSANIYKDAVSLQMKVWTAISKVNQAYVLNTGSPHYVKFVEDLSAFSIVNFGKEIRFSDKYKEKGINVNLAQESNLEILTYERGVEDETLSCGTGATAVALAYAYKHNLFGEISLEINVKGGALKVSFKKNENTFENIYLEGPAVKVYSGVYAI